jgi:hypothetical protein
LFCGQTRHKETYALLPGSDTSAHGIIIVEAHLDSRCANSCDTSCIAYGADDDASGCALVLELARVLSRFSFRHSVLFVLNTGEEQGLFGAEALADYITAKGIKIKAVLNNDIVGGIYCGNTASPPGCSPVDAADSVNVRLFSFGAYNSFHKQLARFVKLEYKEELSTLTNNATQIRIMASEDRTGRSGDHIPFRQHGYTAVRFTSAHEHGDGDPSAPGYVDRQHTSGDSIGVDTNLDLVADSFYVDFRYLERNAEINGNAIAMMGIGPRTPDFTIGGVDSGAVITITTETQYPSYRVGVRTHTNDWDSVYSFSGTSALIPELNNDSTYIFSVASVDSLGVESLFSHETFLVVVSDENEKPGKKLWLTYPNPFDEETVLVLSLNGNEASGEWRVNLYSASGVRVKSFMIHPVEGINEITLPLSGLPAGIFNCELTREGQVFSSGKLVINR